VRVGFICYRCVTILLVSYIAVYLSLRLTLLLLLFGLFGGGDSYVLYLLCWLVNLLCLEDWLVIFA